jgi:hypothetical protein
MVISNCFTVIFFFFLGLIGLGMGLIGFRCWFLMFN